MSDISWTLRTFKISELTDYYKNPRSLTTEQFNHLKTSLDKFGMIDKPIINADAAHTVIGGHQRLRVLRAQRAKEVECWYPSRELDAKEVEELNIRLNKNTGAWDFDVLANQWEVNDLIEWGFEPFELGITQDEPQGEDPGAQVDKAEELRVKWGVETGQMWRLGEHRIICGDCTNAADVARLMGDDRARLIWTDPPYGVDYGAKLDAANPMGYRVRSIQNDDLKPEQLEEFIRSSFKLCSEFSVAGAALYAACPAGTLLPRLIAAFDGSGFTFHWGLVWVKDQLVLSRSDYHFKHENILYGWKDDGAHYFTEDRKQTSVFEYPRPKKSEEHPTMKPVELVEHMIKNSSEVYDVILEPFSGSGTTIIACERLSRKCRAVEISPAYVAVALQRWADMTGQTPELVSNTVE